jgi:hypothetical protein
MASPKVSVWKLAIFNGMTLDFFTSGWEPDYAAIIADRPTLGGTVSTLYWFAADSEVVTLTGTLYGTANKTALETAVKSFIPLTITSDNGSEGVWQVMEYGAVRVQALNYPARQYTVTMKLRLV